MRPSRSKVFSIFLRFLSFRWGCTHNTSDSEYMAGQLASYGYTLVGMIFIHLFELILKLDLSNSF